MCLNELICLFGSRQPLAIMISTYPIMLQVTPGADASKKESPETVADYTLKLLKRRVPPAVPGTPSSRCQNRGSAYILVRLPNGI